MGKKLVHFTPQLKKILEELQKSSEAKYVELNQIIQNTYIDDKEFDSCDGKRYEDNKFQQLKLKFHMSAGEEPKKAKKRRRDEEEAENEAKPPRISFEYTSHWEQDSEEAKLISDLAEDDEDDDEDEDEAAVLNYSDGGDLDINWGKIASIQKGLGSSADPAHFLEVIRCALHHAKASRLNPDKWNLPTTGEQNGRKTADVAVHKAKKEKTVPRNKATATKFVEEQKERLSEDLFKLCEKVGKVTLPVDVKAVYIHAGHVKENSTRQNEIAVNVVIVVDKDTDGTVKTTNDYKKVVPALEKFVYPTLRNYGYQYLTRIREEGWSFDVYREYHNIIEYFQPLLERVLTEETEEERTRLAIPWKPWLQGLNWEKLASKRHGPPWTPERILTRVLKCNLMVNLEIRTEPPPTKPTRTLRNAAPETYYTLLWTRGGDLDPIKAAVVEVVDPFAQEIVHRFGR